MARDTSRYPWIFALRGIAILLVISHHCVQALIKFAGTAPPMLLTLDDLVGPFRMPMLMFVSGMLLQRSIAKPPGRYFGGKAAGIAWPYLLWSVILLALAGGIDAVDLVGLLLAPPTVYWYLWFLLAFYVLAYVVRRVPRGVLIVIALALAVVAPGTLRADRFCFLFAFFIAGDWATRNRAAWERWIRSPWVVVVSACLVVGTALLATTDLIGVRYSVVSVPGVVGMILVALRVLPPTDRVRAFGPLRFAGEHSLVYYVTNWPTVLVVGPLLVPRSGNGFLGYVALFTAVAVIATVLSIASMRSPLMRALFRWPSRRTRPGR
ncbi:acyltransferase family protein [Microbacterium sp.]|uniref:acyltransferase family protein n=1 Tax=Microbacterium sp. TaxID=51671 RepID=UPI003C78FA20